jgi:hypothetical protein
MGRHCLSEPSDLNFGLHPHITGQILSPWTSASTLCSQGRRHQKQYRPLHNNRRIRLPYATALESLDGRFCSKEREIGLCKLPSGYTIDGSDCVTCPCRRELDAARKGSEKLGCVSSLSTYTIDGSDCLTCPCRRELDPAPRGREKLFCVSLVPSSNTVLLSGGCCGRI